MKYQHRPELFGQDSNKIAGPILGVVRLDQYPVTWNEDNTKYKPAPGDIDHPISFNYPVKYAIAHDCKFDNLCDPNQFLKNEILHNKMKKGLEKAIKLLEDNGCDVITSDCGLFMWLQDYATKCTKRPVCMSSLVILPTVFKTVDENKEIAIFTSNAKSLNSLIEDPLRKILGDDADRLVVVGCDDIDGFEAVKKGTKVDIQKVKLGMVDVARELKNQHQNVRAIVVECTEIPPYSDALREVTRLPVYDPITVCDNFVHGFAKQGFTNRHRQWTYEVVGSEP